MKQKLITWGIVSAIVLLIGSHLWTNRTIKLGPGVKAPINPVQTELDRPTPIRIGKYSLLPLAEFQIKAKVLSRKRYWFGKGTDLCPVDLALGWGAMSDERVLEHISISQSGRWYRWSCKELPIPKREIQTHSANMHIIPANDEVEKVLKSVRAGQIVIIDGYLVICHSADGFSWESSLTRDDTGDGACEIVYAKEIIIREGG